jgi:hypothetical protein
MLIALEFASMGMAVSRFIDIRLTIFIRFLFLANLGYCETTELLQ